MDIAGVKCIMEEDGLQIIIEGDIDHHTAKFIREEIDKAIYYYRPSNAVMDLSKITFMDSSGLGLILGRYTHVKEAGGVLKVLDPSACAERVLRLAGAEKIIPIIKNNKR